MDYRVEVIPYAGESEKWDSFVESSGNGTLYHTQRFLGYHPESRFTHFHHFLTLDGVLRGLVTGCLRNENGKKIFASHTGASFGGFVLPADMGLQETDALICAFLNYLERKQFSRADLTLPPQFVMSVPNQHADFILCREGFSFRKREMSAVVPLLFTEDGILDSFAPAARRGVRKALDSGVTVVADDSADAYREYHAILTENLALRHQVKPVHSLAEMIDLKKRFPDRITLLLSMLDSKIIGGIWMFKANRTASIAFYIAHRQGAEALRPVNLLYFESIRLSLSWKVKYFDIGLFSVNMVPNYGLGRFKEQFGAKGLFRDYLAKQF